MLNSPEGSPVQGHAPASPQTYVEHAVPVLRFSAKSTDEVAVAERPAATVPVVASGYNTPKSIRLIEQAPTNLLRVPDTIAQRTAYEVRLAGRALCHGPTLERWRQIGSEQALLYEEDGCTVQAKITSAYLADARGLEPSLANLQTEVTNTGLSAFLFLLKLVGLVLQKRDVTLDLDDLVRGMWNQTRSRHEHLEKLTTIYRWLQTCAALRIIGRRPGADCFRDALTGKRKAPDVLISNEPLIQIEGWYHLPLHVSEGRPPTYVSLRAGRFLERHRRDDRFLQYFGDVCTLARIPRGQPSSATAVSIALALQQMYREEAAYVRRATDGDLIYAKKLKRVTPRMLLSEFPAEPDVAVERRLLRDAENRLDRHSHRAKDIFRNAIRLLMGYNHALTPSKVPLKLIERFDGLPVGTEKCAADTSAYPRDWLDRELDVQPPADLAGSMMQIAMERDRVRERNRRARRRRQRTV